MSSEMETLKLGMVGGGRDAFIGAVHRSAAALDGHYEFVAGALSSSPEKAMASGRDLGLAEERNYAGWEEMLEGELALSPAQRIDAVSIVTPNHMHYPVARAFVEAGFNVICDKPLVHDSAQAGELASLVEKQGTVFAVTYNYSGYPMVRQAREMISRGMLGPLRRVLVEFPQGWLATRVEDEGVKQAQWRTNPEYSGVAGAVGDIGSHAEQLVAAVTGLETEWICADLATFVPGRALDDDAAMLLRYSGGVRGTMVASQVCAGEENALSIRVFGEEAGLAWYQENPNYLSFRANNEPERIYKRGNAYLCEAAQRAARIPPGHPEAFYEAFANIYSEVAGAIRARKRGTSTSEFDFPTVRDGARGVYFIEKVVESAKSELKWTDARWTV
ncbi:MAG: Gfo/Idh/MocA family protein [bacterium]